MGTVEDYNTLCEKVDNFLKEKSENSKNIKNIKKRETKDNNEENECCICYESNNIFIVKTDCKHNICMSCLMQLKKSECPMCRKGFPVEMAKFLQKTNNDPQPINQWFSWSGTPHSVAHYINYT